MQVVCGFGVPLAGDSTRLHHIQTVLHPVHVASKIGVFLFASGQMGPISPARRTAQ